MLSWNIVDIILGRFNKQQNSIFSVGEFCMNG